MRYPVLSASKCTVLANQLLDGSAPTVDSAAEWTGMGDDIDLERIFDVAAAIRAGAREWTDRDRDRFEGKACTKLYDALSAVPTEVLDDRGFWRYLGLRYFWEFIAWREEGPFARGNHMKYVDASSSTESVLTRMYLRAQAVGGSGHAAIAGALPFATDFWRSHVLRVRTGSVPPVTRGFASKQEASRLETNSLRDVARRLNRLWTNIAFYTYDDDAAAVVIEDLWPDTAAE